MPKSRKKKTPKRVLALPDLEQAKSTVLNSLSSASGQRTYDHAMLAMLIGCGIRRGELVSLTLASIQRRDEHWVIADLNGKAGHIRTVPIPSWVKVAIDVWTTHAGITEGRVFRAINKAGNVWGDGMTPKVIWEVVRAAAHRAGIDKLAPHDLRRTCARLCHLAGGEPDQIQFLLGHVSIQTTERYLGCKQKLRWDDGRGRPFERICDHIAERSPDSGLRIDVTFTRVTSTENGLAWQLPFFSVHPG